MDYSSAQFMEGKMIHRLGLAALGSVLLAGCAGTSPDVYPVSIDTAYDKLRSGSLDDFRRARQCGVLVHIQSEGMADKAVRWVVTSSGRTVASWIARLEAVDAENTRITIEVPKAPSGNGEIYDGNQFYQRPALHQPLRPAIRELINSRIEGRPFDVSNSPNGGENDNICGIQRAGLEHGSMKFRVDDKPGYDSRDSARMREAEERQDAADNARFGEPME